MELKSNQKKRELLDSGYVARMLMSILTDMEQLRETTYRLNIQIDALAKSQGVSIAA